MRWGLTSCMSYTLHGVVCSYIFCCRILLQVWIVAHSWRETRLSLPRSHLGCIYIGAMNNAYPPPSLLSIVVHWMHIWVHHLHAFMVSLSIAILPLVCNASSQCLRGFLARVHLIVKEIVIYSSWIFWAPNPLLSLISFLLPHTLICISINIVSRISHPLSHYNVL